jgi:hypothetical protein
MRTKTMILSAILGALTSASVMAQVYSLNAVGYMNVVCPPGFSIIANQLNTTNNTIGSLINIADPVNGTTEECALYKFVNGAFIQTASIGAANITPSNLGGWAPASTTNYTLNPGEAAFFYNATAVNNNNAPGGFPITLTFVGTVVTGNALTVNLLSGFNLVSSIVPQSAGLGATMGLVPSGFNATTANDNNAGADAVYLFSTNGVNYQQTENENDAATTPATYFLPSDPTPNVGQGFFYYNSATISEPWTRAFQVGP